MSGNPESPTAGTSIRAALVEAMSLSMGVTMAAKGGPSLQTFFGSHEGGAIWPNKRGKGTAYARKRRFRGGRFKW